MKKSFVTAILLSLSACNYEHLQPICDERNAIDVPDLPGNYRFLYVTPDFELVEFPLTVRWAGKGQYRMNDEIALTCLIGSRIFVESRGIPLFKGKSETTEKQLSLAEIMSVSTPENYHTFDFIYLGVTTRDLDDAKIPYEIKPSNGEGQVSTLIIDNRNIESEKFASMLRRTSVRGSLDPGIDVSKKRR